jgi:hypothetical protein
VLIDFRPHGRLRAERPADLGASVLPVMTALSESAADLSKVRVVCDWIQYRNNFRDVVEIRPILHGADGSEATRQRTRREVATWKSLSMCGALQTQRRVR